MALDKQKSDNRQNGWNFLATIFYAICIIVTGYLLDKNEFSLDDISLRDMILMILATYRLSRMLVFDKIFRLVRNYIKNKSNRYVFFVIREIITCPWCAGVWVAFVIFLLYYFVPYGNLLVYLLSIAGVASFIVIIINFLGLSVEEKQRGIKSLREESDYSKPE